MPTPLSETFNGIWMSTPAVTGTWVDAARGMRTEAAIVLAVTEAVQAAVARNDRGVLLVEDPYALIGQAAHRCSITFEEADRLAGFLRQWADDPDRLETLAALTVGADLSSRAKTCRFIARAALVNDIEEALAWRTKPPTAEQLRFLFAMQGAPPKTVEFLLP